MLKDLIQVIGKSVNEIDRDLSLQRYLYTVVKVNDCKFSLIRRICDHYGITICFEPNNTCQAENILNVKLLGSNPNDKFKRLIQFVTSSNPMISTVEEIAKDYSLRIVFKGEQVKAA